MESRRGFYAPWRSSCSSEIRPVSLQMAGRYLRKSPRIAIVLCAATLLLSLPLSSCFVRRRVVKLPGTPPSTPLLTATKDELIARVHRLADPIQSFSMRMSMSPSVGSLYAGEVKDYATLGGYILFRRPDDIRVLAQDPVVSSTVVDMVSSGNNFRVYIPSKNWFIEGKNDAPGDSKNRLENLRPEAFLTSLIINPPDSAENFTVLEEDTNERESEYILLMIRRDLNNPWLVRTLHFDRRDLNIFRQETYDPSGSVLSDTRYSGWKPYDGIPFASSIDIKRPQDHYELIINVLSMRMNPPDVTPEKFVLNQPPGSELQRLPRQ